MACLDDGGGRSVMEEMMALFTPPGRETKSKLKKLELHPYYKRPGKPLKNPKSSHLCKINDCFGA